MSTASSTNTKIPPGPKGNFLFGTALQFRKDPLGFLTRVGHDFPAISRFRFAHLPMVFLSHPDYVKHVLQTNNKNYCKGIEYEHLKPVLGTGLLTSEGDFWLRQRRLAQPAFHRDRIASFINTMVKCTDEMLQEWKNKKEADIHHEMMGLALDIVARTLLSADVKKNASQVEKSLEVAIQESFTRVQALINLPLWLPVPRHLRYKHHRDALDKIVHEIIAQKRNAPSSDVDLLDMLMQVIDEETGERMSDAQLRDEVMTIFLAGHETTANALTWTFYLLSQHPESEKKLKAELNSVLNGRNPSMDDLKSLSYTQQIIHEALRLYPPAWIVGRTALEDDEINGFKIKKGDNIIISPYVMHRDPAIWERADEFFPERFTSEKLLELHKFAYFPFGGGPRFCIGNNFAMMEMQIIIAMVYQFGSLSLKKDQLVATDPLITLRPKQGMNMNILKNGSIF